MNWTRIPSLHALRALESATRLGSFSAAARELNVTPAAIAHHVRGLETDLGKSLVVRDGRGISALPDGRVLADGLAEGFALIAEAVEQTRAEVEARPLTLAVTPSFATDWLMPRIGDFWARHPEITININPSADLVDLRRDDVDLAIRWGEGPWPGLESEPFTDGDFWVVAHPRLLGGLTEPTLEDVQDLPWVLETYLLERVTLLEHEGLDSSRLNSREMRSNELTRAAARAGQAVAILPKALVERSVKLGELVLVHAFGDSPMGYHMVTVPGRVSPRLRILKSWLREQAKSD